MSTIVVTPRMVLVNSDHTGALLVWNTISINLAHKPVSYHETGPQKASLNPPMSLSL